MSSDTVPQLWKTSLLITHCMLIACSSATPPAGANEPPADEIPSEGAYVDENYRFFITQLGPGWRILEPEAAARVDRAAVFVATHSDQGLTALILIEPAPEQDLEQLARVTAENSQVQNIHYERMFHTTIQGREALHVVHSGELRGQMTRVIRRLFINEGFLYQIHVAGQELYVNSTNEHMAEFMRAFRLMNGEVRPISRFPGLEPYQTLTSHLTEQRYETAGFGLHIELVGNWRFIENDETDVEIVFANANPRVFGRLYAYRIPPPLHDVFLRIARQVFLEQRPNSDRRPTIPLEIDGLAVDFHRSQTNGIELLSGVYCRVETCIQVNYSFVNSRVNNVLASLDELPRITILEEEENQRLAAELLNTIETRRFVTENISVRPGRVILFPEGVDATLPSPHWTVSAGTEAQALGSAEDCILVLEQQMLGVAVYLYSQTLADGSDTIEALHQSTLETVVERTNERTSTIKLGEGPAILTRFLTPNQNGIGSIEVGIISAMRGQRFFTLIIEGYEAFLSRAQSEIDALLSGFNLSSSTIMRRVHHEDRFDDRRIGFSVSLPEPNWHVEESDLQFWNGRGSKLTFRREGLIFDLQVLSPLEHPASVVTSFADRFRSTLLGRADVSWRRGHGSLLGQSCEMTIMTVEGEVIELCTVQHDGLVFIAFSSSENDQADHQEVRDRVSLIDEVLSAAPVAAEAAE